MGRYTSDNHADEVQSLKVRLGPSEAIRISGILGGIIARNPTLGDTIPDCTAKSCLIAFISLWGVDTYSAISLTRLRRSRCRNGHADAGHTPGTVQSFGFATFDKGRHALCATADTLNNRLKAWELVGMLVDGWAIYWRDSEGPGARLGTHSPLVRSLISATNPTQNAPTPYNSCCSNLRYRA